MKSLSGIGVLLFLLLIPPAYSYTGRIIFTGYIYQSPCNQVISSTSVTYSCRQGAQESSHTVALTTAQNYLPMGLGTSELKWINDTHSMGVLEVAYR